MKVFVSVVLGLTMMVASMALASSELLEGKTPNAKCSVRMAPDQDLISFAGDGVAFGFLVTEKTINEALKKGQKSVTVTGNDGPVSARLTMNFSDSGVVESANYSQRTFLVSKRVKCTDLK